MDFAENLEIFIITFNRAKRLDNTLSQIFDANSPIKNFGINVIDNNSTDNTFDIVQKYRLLHKNLNYEKNKYNIGGNANIVKAYYKANKEYVWVLADNDDFCWDGWSEVEKFLAEKADAIVVANYESPKYDIAQLFDQMTFLPGVIYKTSNIDDTVMGNMEFNISNMFPHLALAAKLINENKKVSIVENAIVLVRDNRDENGEYTYTRGYQSDNLHPLQKGMNWISGYANSLYLIKNKKIRNYIISHNRFCTELNSAKLFYWMKEQPEQNLYNYLCIFAVLSLFDKVRFIVNLILFYTLYRLIYLRINECIDRNEGSFVKQCNLFLLGCIKMKRINIKKKIKGEY